MAPVDSGSDSDGSASDGDDGSVNEEESRSDEEYDSAAEHDDDDDNNEAEGEDDNSVEVSDQYSSDEFEDQGSSDDDEDRLARQAELDSDEDDDSDDEDGAAASLLHTDNLSSDDEDPTGTDNRIGRVPLHWYDDYSHIGYDAHGNQVIKSSSAFNNQDLLDQAIQVADEMEGDGKFKVYDALNARDVTLTPRQIELIRRLQSGAFAHPEHDANPDYIDYFSGVDPEISGINSNRYEKKSRFQPSKWEKLQVRRLLHRLKCGSINMDDKPFELWKGDEEDELALRKGPQHMPAPKLPPPGHAFSYNPPEEYLPTKEELAEWSEMDPEDRPYGHYIPQKFHNLRSVGAYQHAVKERFERCLDLYLCPRAMKRRLNIDPESLVPQLPRASDLRPFPTTKCIRYEVPGGDESGGDGVVRCLSVSPEGQYLASGGEDGVVRLWEVQTGRLLRSWDLVDKPIASLEWNPNRSHHTLLAAIGQCSVIISTGTAGPDDAEVTDALLSAAASCKNGGNVAPDSRASKAVKWISLKKKYNTSKATPISAYGGTSGPIALIRTNKDISSLRWHRKGDYFVTVSPKAGAASVLIHQLSKAASQQPFGKMKGEAQLACFHPQKPFLFVASKEHVRVYHLVKQVMVKRLMSGCRHISSLDVHVSGDHLVVGSLDRRLVWFDLDLASTPYKTLKYHERALRSVGFHPRYPLMASASDDGSIHVFHSMVYSDLMRNPLIVPVKVLRGHSVVNSLGALAMVFHPTQPWLFSAGADGKIHLFQDL
ncbi:predicted protein [Thalassiosira pseudonana CCMP1335]|uniref:Ribosome biogenesis protein BOP1 homolog n=1 Tax=Thalassiosira pseudonana TaxID=35128 RepID=B8CG69_THAPS|nr:predicted protein [Thalassiosira pseudonana CCMP1335]EED87521.1 predicted protein [Thalassiosira pseudonana CCMP1335]